ncbi:putrescine export ABC transporter permease SapB [Xenorhabdus japonica]|uniref:Cationic peptide transport system permease protein n=1 Tax=Xenorhabdus japonica TaxID=53341 RepID=A0A1I5D158_9GAMM|nr:putrescine export ABC transporter permease SapB [Xenorhabdus japonica]SFN92965.1 cationic peptide transport system permease protein [Xenorhabdus japonica]
MIIYILRRLLLLIVTLFFLSFISFSLMYFTPSGSLSGVPLLDAYVYYVYNLFQWDFGVSKINGQQVIEQLYAVLPATMEFCILSFSMALLIGIPLGIIAGVWRNKKADIIISTLTLCGFSIPVFWLALLLILLCSLSLTWLPVSGRFYLLYQPETVTGSALIDVWLSKTPYHHEMVINVVMHMILPVITLSVVPTTEVIRLMRNSVEEISGANYIKSAATRGLSRLTIIRRHLLHNALPPIIPKLGLQFSTMLTLAMVTEKIFGWPGLGPWLINAIQQQDYPAISAGIIVIGTLIISVNMLTDIIGVIANPLKHKEWYALR